MSELWTPDTNKIPDVTNLFDMMLVFQEQLDNIADPSAKFTAACIALRSLSATLRNTEAEEEQVVVATTLAVVGTDQPVSQVFRQDVGLSGFVFDVDCISRGEYLAPSIAININAVSLHPAEDPDDLEYIMTTARAPINHVRYIETLTA